MSFIISLLLLLSATVFDAQSGQEQETDPPKHLMLIAGSASHSTGTHEHRAGVLLFERCLATIEGLEVSTHFEGWPEEDSVFMDADAAVFYMDGCGNHPVVQENRLALIQSHIDRGTGKLTTHKIFILNCI